METATLGLPAHGWTIFAGIAVLVTGPILAGSYVAVLLVGVLLNAHLPDGRDSHLARFANHLREAGSKRPDSILAVSGFVL
ncbi:MAG: hypothetical protein JWO71_1539 [Candidatus Acidoferrum typicum]|nr:hypothetical protein [Candidatus Acidoferrum typicum]